MSNSSSSESEEDGQAELASMLVEWVRSEGYVLDDPRDFGSMMWRCYQQTGDPAWLDDAIEAAENVIELALAPEDPVAYTELGLRLDAHFEHTDDMDDLQGTIAAFRSAVDRSSSDDPDITMRLTNLGAALFESFKRTNDLHNLDDTILAFCRAVELTPDNHHRQSARLVNFGHALMARFKNTGDLKDVENAISALRRAVEHLSDNNPEAPTHYSALGNTLLARHERLDRSEDLEASVSAHRRAVQLTPEENPDLPMFLVNLGSSLLARFERLGELADIEACVAARRRAVSLTPEGHSDQPTWLSVLGISLYARFRRLGEPEDMESAISMQRRAIGLTSEGHYELPFRYNYLGLALSSRFERFGKLEDIGGSISAHRRALELMHEGHPDLPKLYNNLGFALRARFERLGELEDLEAAISAHRQAIDLTADDHPHKPAWIGNLGSSLLARFRHTDELEDVEASVAAHSRSVELTPEEHPWMSGHYNNLGIASRHLYEHTGELSDLESAISALRRAIELTPAGHVEEPLRYSNLGGCFQQRFKAAKTIADLDMAVAMFHKAIDISPDGHPGKQLFLENLGGSLQEAFEQNPSQAGFDSTIGTFMDASSQTSASPTDRLEAAARCVAMLSSHVDFASPDALLLAHGRVLDILPEVVWLGYGVQRRYAQSAQIGELVNDAVAAAISNGALEQAIEWLEAGRSLVWFQILSLRIPLDDVAEQYPELADALRIAQQKLRVSGYAMRTGLHPNSATDRIPGIILDEDIERHRQLTIEYEKVISDIRQRSGFENFLRPKTLSALLISPELVDGPVIFINIHSSRCDALVLYPSQAISTVPLPDLTLERADRLQSLWVEELKGHRIREYSTIPSEKAGASTVPQSTPHLINTRHSSRVQQEGTHPDNLLELLWRWVVSPVLELIKSSEPIYTDKQPHITWCPTGPLMQLPLHAAGIYSEPSGARAFNSFVSSYTTSLSALQRSAEDAAKRQVTPSVLVVTQPATPGQSKLPGTVTEGRRIQRVIDEEKIAGKILDNDQAVLASIRDAMRRYPWVHLACHGSQYIGDATRSAFHLYDGPLSLSDLMSTAADDAELAFLSACQTATGDNDNPEESAHLAAGMLAVGFKGVVATMWSIGDNDAPVVVEAYYRKLLEMRRTGAVVKGQTGAAYALHEALKVLRERVGEKDFASWAPFVHFGV